MLIPLFILSIGAIFAGWYFYDAFVGHDYKAFWDGAIYTAKENTVLKDKYDVPEWVFWAPLIVTVIGFVIATFTYLFNRGVGKRIADNAAAMAAAPAAAAPAAAAQPQKGTLLGFFSKPSA